MCPCGVKFGNEIQSLTRAFSDHSLSSSKRQFAGREHRFMTMRGFLACYLGAVALVGATGASAYHELQRRQEAVKLAAAPPPAPVISIPVEEATPPAPAVVAPTPSMPVAEPQVATPQLPKLRPHVVAQARPVRRLRPHVAPVQSPYWPPPPPPAIRYAYPVYSAYGGYCPTSICATATTGRSDRHRSWMARLRRGARRGVLAEQRINRLFLLEGERVVE